MFLSGVLSVKRIQLNTICFYATWNFPNANFLENNYDNRRIMFDIWTLALKPDQVCSLIWRLYQTTHSCYLSVKMLLFETWNCLISWNFGYSWKAWVHKWKAIKINSSIIVSKISSSAKLVFAVIAFIGSTIYLQTGKLLTSAVRSSSEVHHQR